MAMELAVFVAVAIVWGDLRYQMGGMKSEIRAMKERCNMRDCYAPTSRKGGGA